MKMDDFIKIEDIIMEHWVSDFDDTQIEIKRMIKEEFYSGIWGFLLNRLIAWSFDFFLTPDIRKKAIKQFEIYINAAKEYTGKDEEIIEKYFDFYLINDVGYIRCKRNHPKFSELKERMKKSLLLRVAGTKELLESKGETHDELLKNAHPNKEEALESILLQLQNAEDNLNFAIEEKLLKISSLIRESTIKILRKEIEFARNYFKEKIDELYSN